MIDQVYQQAILDLARAADGAGGLLDPDASATVDNPVCGDRVTVDVRLADGAVAALGHRVRGCLLCEATAAVLGRRAVGEPPGRLHDIRTAFIRMIREDGPAPAGWPELEAFTPVRGARSRHECVLLPFAALADALNGALNGTRAGIGPVAVPPPGGTGITEPGSR